MAKVYKRSDRIPVKIGDITIKLAPMTVDQKTECQQAFLKGKSKGDLAELTRGVFLSLKYSVKSVEGLTDSNDEPYKLALDENGNVSDEGIDDLLNLQVNKQLTQICASLTNGIPSEFTDDNGVKLEGVEILKTSSAEKSEKN